MDNSAGGQVWVPEGKFGPLQGATDAASRNVLLYRAGVQARVALRYVRAVGIWSTET